MKKLAILARVLIGVMAVLTVIMEVAWVPRVTDYAQALFLWPGQGIEICLWVLAVLIGVVSLIMLALAWRLPGAMENDTVFTIKTANVLKLVALLILLDGVLLSGVALLLIILGDGVLAPALAFFAVIGFVLSALLFVLSDYVKKAAYLKEEADYTL